MGFQALRHRIASLPDLDWAYYSNGYVLLRHTARLLRLLGYRARESLPAPSGNINFVT